MISAIVQGWTFDKAAPGEALYFRHKPHWDARFNYVGKHKTLLLLSGQRTKAFRIVMVRDTGGSYEVLLGEQLTPVRQEPLFSSDGK